MRTRAFLSTLKQEIVADRIGEVAAMMTYYALFALFPMLILVLTIALLAIPESVIQEGVGMATKTLPGEAGKMLQQQAAHLQSAANAGFAVGGALLALWSSSRGTAALGNALNDMFEKKETRPWWKRQLLAIGVTLLVAILMSAALGLLVIGPWLGHLVADRVGLGGAFDVAWGIGRWALAAVLVMAVWAILYRWLPNTKASFRIFTPGAVVGVLLWIGLTQGFSLYVSHFGKYEKTYGALAGIVIFLTWLWLSNLCLLLGAEINDVQAELRKDRSAPARQLADARTPEEEATKGEGKPPRPRPGVPHPA